MRPDTFDRPTSSARGHASRDLELRGGNEFELSTFENGLPVETAKFLTQINRMKTTIDQTATHGRTSQAEPLSLQSDSLRLTQPLLTTKSVLADHLVVSARNVANVLSEHGIEPNPAGRYDWRRVWSKFWNIHDVKQTQIAIMQSPLLTVEDVAPLVGVSARSILRDGDRARPRYGLPHFIQLSQRARRYHPEMILLWQLEAPLEDWMKPVVKRGRRGVRPRIKGRSSGSSPP